MLERLKDPDWGHVFSYAGEVKLEDDGTPSRWGYDGRAALDPVVDYHGTLEPFTREDVTEIVAIEEGCNDEADWLVVGRLKDGRWFGIRSGCDYTGWG